MTPVYLLDQFIVSRGLYYGKQNLEMDLNHIRIFKETANDSYGSPMTMKELDGRPMSFEWIKKDKNGKPVEIRKGREPNSGFSDHFPIQGVVKTV